ncbi:MAG: hypothetical protein K5664_03945, partial [Firmicutes bacterium]|nr:hypothetical protein [Bacillota bacterium]
FDGRSGNLFDDILNQAKNIGITKNVVAVKGQELNAGMLLALCYNALDCCILERNSIDGFTKDQNKTLLSERLKVHTVKGIVSSTAFTSLVGAGAAKSATIAGVQIDDPDGIANDYIGMDVVAYFSEDHFGKEGLICVCPTANNRILELLPEELDIANSTYTEIRYSDRNTGRTSRVRIDNYADIIYNGKAFPSYSLSDYDIKMGCLRFLDNNNDSVADVVFIEEYENYVADVVNITSNKIYDVYGKCLNLEDCENIFWRDMYGDKIDISQVSKWNVLSVKASKDGDLINIAVYDDPVTGDVQSIETNGFERRVTIDGDTFGIADSYETALLAGNANAKEIVLSQSGTYYLDANEKIAAVLLDEVSSWRYAYLISAKYKRKDDIAAFKLIYDNTDTKTFLSGEKVRIDGKKYNSEDAVEYFSDGTNTIPQLIKFTLNGQGEVEKIDTLVIGSGETSENLTKTLASQTGYWSVRTRRVGKGAAVGVKIDPSTTRIFQIPELAADKYDESKYSVRTKVFANNESITYDAYDIDEFGVAKAVVMRGKNVVLGSPEKTTIVTKTVKMLIEDEVYTVLQGIDCSGKEVSLKIEDTVDVSKLSAGDIVICALDYKGDVSDFTYFYDNETGTATENMDSTFSVGDKNIGKNFTESHKLFNTTGDYNASYVANAQHYLTANVIAEKMGNCIKAYVPGTTFAGADKDDYSQIQIFEKSSAKIFLCKDKKVEAIQWDDLEEYVYSRNSNARALILSTYSQLLAVF